MGDEASRKARQEFAQLASDSTKCVWGGPGGPRRAPRYWMRSTPRTLATPHPALAPREGHRPLLQRQATPMPY